MTSHDNDLELLLHAGVTDALARWAAWPPARRSAALVELEARLRGHVGADDDARTTALWLVREQLGMAPGTSSVSVLRRLALDAAEPMALRVLALDALEHGGLAGHVTIQELASVWPALGDDSGANAAQVRWLRVLVEDAREWTFAALAHAVSRPGWRAQVIEQLAASDNPYGEALFDEAERHASSEEERLAISTARHRHRIQRVKRLAITSTAPLADGDALVLEEGLELTLLFQLAQEGRLPATSETRLRSLGSAATLSKGQKKFLARLQALLAQRTAM